MSTVQTIVNDRTAVSKIYYFYRITPDIVAVIAPAVIWDIWIVSPASTTVVNWMISDPLAGISFCSKIRLFNPADPPDGTIDNEMSAGVAVVLVNMISLMIPVDPVGTV
jgi:hypothetical protein